MLCLPVDDIYRKVFTFFVQMCLNDDSFVNLKSPTYSMFTYVKRYNLTELLIESLYKDNHGQISVYKDEIKNVVFKYYEVLESHYVLVI